MRHSIHSRIQFKTKLIYILSSAGDFSPVSFAMPFFSLTNFVGLFSFQLLTFVCRTPCQSGTFESKNRHISKRGSPRLRKTLFQIMSTIIQHAPADNPVFQFLDRKRQEGKHYYVYMTAAANKFLRIYYGTVRAYLEDT